MKSDLSTTAWNGPLTTLSFWPAWMRLGSVMPLTRRSSSGVRSNRLAILASTPPLRDDERVGPGVAVEPLRGEDDLLVQRRQLLLGGAASSGESLPVVSDGVVDVAGLEQLAGVDLRLGVGEGLAGEDDLRQRDLRPGRRGGDRRRRLRLSRGGGRAMRASSASTAGRGGADAGGLRHERVRLVRVRLRRRRRRQAGDDGDAPAACSAAAMARFCRWRNANTNTPTATASPRNIKRSRLVVGANGSWRTSLFSCLRQNGAGGSDMTANASGKLFRRDVRHA